MTTAKKILTLALCLTCLTAGKAVLILKLLKAHHHNQKAATARR